LSGPEAAIGLARIAADLNRPLGQEEIRTLATHFKEPSVAVAMIRMLESPASRNATLQALLALRTDLDAKQLEPAIEAATQTLWKQASSDQTRKLALQVAGAFRLQGLDQSIAQFVASPKTTQALKLAALRSLRELGSTELKTLAKIAASENESQAVRDAALAALAESPAEEGPVAIAGLLIDLHFDQRQSVIARMATSRSGALALLKAVEEEDIAPEDLSPTVLETMQALLPDSEAVKDLWSDVAGQIQRVLRLPGENADFVHSPITLAGPFTVESWVRLSPGIGNADGILGRPELLDMNFYDDTFRVWIAGQKDIVVANQKVVANAWTHLAVTRDAEGRFRIYINGELSAESTRSNTETFADLKIGRTIPHEAGTDGALTEYRIWNVARTSRQIRDNFDRSFAGEDRPDGLVHYFDGTDWGRLSGKAVVQPTLEAPKLLSAAQAKQQAEMFAKYRQLAEHPGDASVGKAIFEKTCLVCHQQDGKGGNIGPPLDGIGLTGTETLLRNILSPSAAMEGGYRNFRVLTDAGRIVQGLLVSQDSTAVVLRQPDTADQRIPKSGIERAGFTSISVMPSDLLDSFQPQQVSDLFAHLHSLKQSKKPSNQQSTAIQN
jgi:putative heme-binding domain-containing protein